MKLKIIQAILYLAITVLPFSSCSKSDNEVNEPEIPTNPVNPDNPENPDNESAMSPSAASAYIKDTAVEALSRFNPEDQRELLQLAKSFIELYGDYEMPDEFISASENSPVKIFKALDNCIRRHNSFGITRASYDYSIIKYSGIYEPDSRNEKWVKTDDSNSVIFRAPVMGKMAEICAEPSEGSWVIENNDAIHIPNTLTTTVKYGSAILSSVTVKSNADIDNGIISLDYTANIANISVSVILNGNNSKLKETGRLSTSGKTIISSETEITGQGLCDIDSWRETEDINKKLTAGSITINTLDRVYISANCLDFSNTADYLDCWYDSYSGISKNTAENHVIKACEEINRNLQANIKFADSNSIQASLFWTPVVFSDYSYWEIYPGAAVKYAYDGSTELIGSVDYNFDIVTYQFENLIKRYKDFMRSLF